MRLRRLIPHGLRARIVLALIATSVVTLAVAALALLPPLEHRLKREELQALADTAVASRPGFLDLEPKQLARGSPRLARLSRALARRTGGRVAVFDSQGRALTNTDPAPDRFEDVGQAAVRGKTVKSVATSPSDSDVARVAMPLRVRDHRYVIVLRKTLDDAPLAVRVVKHAFLVASLAGLVTAVLLGLAITGRVLRRLRRLRDATSLVARRGPAVELTPDNSPDEVGDLARSFSTMQARLREQEQARRTFVATASHELRTPLASLRMMLELLQEDLAQQPPDVEDAREQAASAGAQSRRLASLAADLLDLSRIDSEADLRSEPVPLAEVGRAVTAEFASVAEERGAELQFEAGAETCWASGDPGAVARIARILVDNALRFSPPSQPVTVTVADDGGAPVLTVQDSGPGVPEDERELIFNRFQRGSATGDEAGFGLGLAIGRELAERMGGALCLEPSAEGARFALRLRPAERLREPVPG
ncbi:MAG: sensor histidine kinase [Thermoleophilaceae bacterium]